MAKSEQSANVIGTGATRRELSRIVSDIEPWDEVEAGHREVVLE